MSKKTKKEIPYPFDYKDEMIKGFIKRLKELDYIDSAIGRLTADFMDAVGQLENEGGD